MNDSKAAGVFDEAKGKLKQAVGETFNDQSMANSGAADEVKGHAEQTWGSVKDAAHNLTHSHKEHSAEIDAQDDAHNFRSGITDAAANAKESIQRGLGHLEHKAKE